jgi:hypothetical protein
MTPTMSIAAAIAIVAMLAIYAAYLGMQLRRQGKDQRASLEIFEQTRIQKDKEARQSIRIISRALVQKELSDTEAAMRIGFLSQQVIATTAETELFSVFKQLAEATSHIPILDDWVNLERSEKRRFTIERERIEKGYSEFIHSSASQLAEMPLAFSFPR